MLPPVEGGSVLPIHLTDRDWRIGVANRFLRTRSGAIIPGMKRAAFKRPANIRGVGRVVVLMGLAIVALAVAIVLKERGDDATAPVAQPAAQPAAQVQPVDPAQQQRLADEQAQWARAFEEQRARQEGARQAEAAPNEGDDVAQRAQAQEQAQAQLQLAVDARLEEERQRLLAAGAAQPQPTWSSAPAPQPMSRCSQAKAQRDQAYRVVGNNRTYDFIRRWDDIVFEACKTP